MKNNLLNETEAKYYSYITGLINTMANYYNYKLLKSANNNDNLEKLVEFNAKELQKYFYCDLKEEQSINYGVLVSGNITELIIAEVISFGYRLLEEMGIEDLVIKINDKYKKIFQYLDVLEVDYEVNNLFNDFAITSEDVVLINGKIKDNKIKFKGSILVLLKLLEDIYQKQNLSNYVDVYIIATNLEEQMYGLKILQDLRWSEIKADMDMANLSLTEQNEKAKVLNAREIIILNAEDLKKGIITIKDSLTQEEVKIDETEVLDYLLSNL